MWNTKLWNDLESMRVSMDDLYDRSGYKNKRASFPLINTFENSDAYTLVAELPGVKKENVNITYNDGVLVCHWALESVPGMGTSKCTTPICII